MNAIEAAESFVSKWIDNPTFEQWPPRAAFAALDPAQRERFYEAATEKIRVHPTLSERYWRGSTSAERERLVTIMAVGLCEKERRAKGRLGAEEDVDVWRRRALARVDDRLLNRVAEMPLTQADAAVYRGMIERRARLGGAVSKLV